MRLLVVEDNKVNRLILVRALKKWDHEVFEAEHGLEALKVLEEHPDIQVVLTDWVMPEMNGIELVRALRSQERAFYLYIIMVTLKENKNSVEMGREAGVDDFLRKPIDFQELQARLNVANRIITLMEDLSDRNKALENQFSQVSADMAIAARVQKSLLPNKALPIDDVSVAWEVKPCEDLGGDSLNFIALDDDHIAAYVLDVTGHGVAAAMLTTQVSRLLMADSKQNSVLKQRIDEPPYYRLSTTNEVFNRLNHLFPLNDMVPQFIAMVLVIINVKKGTMQWSSAGNPQPVLVRNGKAITLNGGENTPIGAFAEMEAEEHLVDLQPDDRIYMFSDGLTETTNRSGEMLEPRGT